MLRVKLEAYGSIVPKYNGLVPLERLLIEMAVHLAALKSNETALEYLEDAETLTVNRKAGDWGEICHIISSLRCSLTVRLA